MTLHLVLTDVRRFRWPLLAWCVLITLYTWVMLLAPAFVSDVRQQQMRSALTLLGIIVFIATVVLAALVVQGDTTISTDAFWLTRPIHPLRLLSAKTLVLAGAIIALPGAIEIAVMAASHMPPSAIARVAVESTASGLFWLALFMASAAMARNLGMLALTWLGIMVGVVVLGIVMSIILASQGSTGMSAVLIAPGESLTAQAVWIVGLILAFEAVLIVQYRRRNRILALAAGLIAAVAAFLAAGHWPLLLLDAPAPTPPAWAGEPGAVRLTAASERASFDSRSNAPQWLRLPVRVGNVAPGWIAYASLVDGAMTVQGRTLQNALSSNAWPLPFDGSNLPPRHATVRGVLSVARVRTTLPEEIHDILGLALTEADRPPLPWTDVSYTGRFAIELSRADLVGTAPLSRGASIQDDTYRLRVEETALRNNAIYVRTTQISAKATLDRRLAPIYELYAVNDARSEAISIFQSPESDRDPDALLKFSAHLPLFGAGFSRAGWVSDPESWQDKDEAARMPIDAAWIAGAHLALIRWTTAGQVERTIAIPHLTVCGHGPPGC